MATGRGSTTTVLIPQGSGESSPSLGHPGARPRVLLTIRELSFHQEVLDFLERDPRLEVVGACTDLGRARALIQQARPEILVVCPDTLPALHHPAVQAPDRLVVVSQEMTVPVLREAIGGGASGVFAWPEERSELLDAVRRLPRPAADASSKRGRVIAVCGARGGAGATFVATHLAAAHADRRRTVLVDADVHYGDVTVALGFRPEDLKNTVADLVPVAEELGPDHVEEALMRHPAGFGCLLAPAGPDPAVPPGLHAGAVALLAGLYQTIVVHLPRSLDERARRLASMADDVVLITTLDVFSLYGARRTLVALGLEEMAARCRVVINRAGRSEFRPKDVRRILGMEPAATIRFDGAVRRAQTSGRLLSRRARGAGRDLRAFARSLAPEPAPRRGRKGA